MSNYQSIAILILLINVDEFMSDIEFYNDFWDELKNKYKIKNSKENAASFHSGMLISLNLEHDNIKKLPISIGSFSNLKVLDISFNSLEYLPESISNLESLQEFYLHGNKIKELPKAIGSLNKLKILKLSENKLTNLPNTISPVLGSQVNTSS